MSRHIHGRSGAGSFHIPDSQSLNLVADLHAAHALDALRGIADQREVLVPRLVFRLLFEWNVQDIQVAGNLL